MFEPTLLEHDKLGIHTLVCGAWHTFGLTHRGDVYVWGTLTEANLGILDSVEGRVKAPQMLLYGKDIINVFTGGYSSSNYAQSRDGKMYVWGRNATYDIFQN